MDIVKLFNEGMSIDGIAGLVFAEARSASIKTKKDKITKKIARAQVELAIYEECLKKGRNKYVR